MDAPVQTSLRGVEATRRIRQARTAVTIVFFVHGLLLASWTAHIPHLQRQLAASNGALGTALFGAPLGSVLAMLAVGKALAIFGSRRVVRWTLIGYCLASALVGLANSIPQLFAALTVWGLFQGALDVAMNAHATEVEAVVGHPIMSRFHGFWSIGTLTGAVLGTALAGAGVSLLGQFLPLGTAIAIATVGLGRRLLPSACSLDEPVPHGSRRLLSPKLALLGLVAFAGMLCEGASADWSAVHLRTDLSASATTAGTAYVYYSLAMAGTRLAAPRLFTRFAPGKAIPALAVVATLGMTVGLVTGSTAATLAGFAALGLGIATIVPTAFSVASRIRGVSAGSAIAAVSALGWAGFVCGPPLIGHVSESTGLTTALGLLPVLTGAVAVVIVAARLFPTE